MSPGISTSNKSHFRLLSKIYIYADFVFFNCYTITYSLKYREFESAKIIYNIFYIYFKFIIKFNLIFKCMSKFVKYLQKKHHILYYIFYYYINYIQLLQR